MSLVWEALEAGPELGYVPRVAGSWKVLEQDGATSRPVEVVAGPRVRGLGGWRWGMEEAGGGACRFRSVRRGWE